MKKRLTYYGEVEISSPQETTEGTVTIDNRQVELDLNFYDGVPVHDNYVTWEN